MTYLNFKNQQFVLSVMLTIIPIRSLYLRERTFYHCLILLIFLKSNLCRDSVKTSSLPLLTKFGFEMMFVQSAKMKFNYIITTDSSSLLPESL